MSKAWVVYSHNESAMAEGYAAFSSKREAERHASVVSDSPSWAGHGNRDTLGTADRYGRSAQLIVLGGCDLGQAYKFLDAITAKGTLPPGYNCDGPESGVLKLDGPSEVGCL
jgi:hypothetical protein